MLQIHIGSITERGLKLDEREDASKMPLLRALASDGSIRFIRPIHVHVNATQACETIRVAGKVESTARVSCSRCLEPFDMEIIVDFTTTAVPETQSVMDPETENEVEIAADEIDAIAYQGDSLDLGDEIAQQIIMSLPFKPLCRDACKGLCSRCGADLNQAACQCHFQDQSSPFAVLRAQVFPKNKKKTP